MPLWRSHHFVARDVFQCGARLGEDSGREDWDPAQALGLPLGEGDMGELQVRAGFEVSVHFSGGAKQVLSLCLSKSTA